MRHVRNHARPARKARYVVSLIAAIATLAVSAGVGVAKTPAASSEPLVLKVGITGNSGPWVYAQATGVLEEKLKPLNVEVKWVPVVGAFSTTLPALTSGEIDIEQAPLTGAVSTFAKDLPYRMFGINDPYPNQSSGIIVPAGSSIRSVKDLVGKKVAVNAGAKGEYVLLRALELNNIPFDQVTRVPIQPPAAASAFASGELDAWATFQAFFDTAVANGARVIVRETKLESDDALLGAVARTDLIKDHPEVVKKFQSVINSLYTQQREDPAAFQNIVQKTGPTAISGQSLTDAIALAKLTSDLHSPGPEDYARAKRISKLFLDAKVTQTAVNPKQLFATVK